MKSDLETILKAITEIPQIEMSHLKAFLLMLLKGVSELHARGIMHRDLKPNNLLLSKDKTLYICDFGMAKQIESNSNSTNHQHSLQVITRAYRPPEIFFGKQNYGVEVDMWSVGCVFAEMLLRQPFFDGNSDIDHLCMIFQKLGSPNECGWKV
jgi:serine/threonine protein kinase